MFMNENELLNLENFVDEKSWFEFLKIEIDELVSFIKKIAKLTYVNDEPIRLRDTVMCLAKCKNEILKATGILPNKEADDNR